MEFWENSVFRFYFFEVFFHGSIGIIVFLKCVFKYSDMLSKNNSFLVLCCK